MLLYVCFAAFTGWETKNRYSVTDIRGNTIFYVSEDSNICTRLCLGSYRPCEFSIFNQERRQVLRMIRPFRCTSCCCPCYLQVVVLAFSVVRNTCIYTERVIFQTIYRILSYFSANSKTPVLKFL